MQLRHERAVQFKHKHNTYVVIDVKTEFNIHLLERRYNPCTDGVDPVQDTPKCPVNAYRNSDVTSMYVTNFIKFNGHAIPDLASYK